MKNSVKFTAIGALVAGSLLIAPSAFADDVVQTVTAGERTASVANITLGAVATSHAAASSVGSLTLNADDSTGSGAGWNVTQIVTDLAPTPAMVSAGATVIPAAGITATIGAVSSTAGQDATGVTPTAGAVALNVETTVLSAAAQSGMGTYTAPVALAVAIPANTYAGAYTGTLTTTISSAP
ncbi:WxL domain-containing protein [Mycetocola miduiensis]|uniref:WxL domain surface cell wall-binding n=1 Tax=Mycetocola miduiensis TaxID=995034 RepID=A0A1I5CV19_9MICO|nr:WxL domain-containing protein [Mycetocola miduiensis]SFN90716.1 WxL domain surface cell wall-binding [Mycetocola miduiensis]